MSPTLEDALDRLRVVSIPMAVRFRGVSEREVALFAHEDATRWSEWSPFLEYEPAEAAVWLSAALSTETPPAPQRMRVPVNATLPAVEASRAPDVLARYGLWRTVKIKVAERGQSLDDDLARVRTVREAHPDARIRIDANGGWDVDQAERALRALSVFGIEYAEQPVPTVEELSQLRRRYDAIPIAADESIRKAEDPIRVARMGAADVIVVKAQPLGGVRRALEVIGEAGLPAVVSSALETSVGLAEGVALAAALDSLPYDCGLATGALLAGDVTDERLLPTWDGTAAVLPVFSPAVSERHVEEFAATADRVEHWRERLRAAWQHIR